MVVLFDLLCINGEDCTQKPLLERKRRLEKLFKDNLLDVFIMPRYEIIKLDPKQAIEVQSVPEEEEKL